MRCMAKFSPKSSHILSAEYEPSTRAVIVTFHNNSRYLYSGVLPEAWENWQRYRSAGEYFQAIIRRYPSTKLDRA